MNNLPITLDNIKAKVPAIITNFNNSLKESGVTPSGNSFSSVNKDISAISSQLVNPEWKEIPLPAELTPDAWPSVFNVVYGNGMYLAMGYNSTSGLSMMASHDCKNWYVPKEFPTTLMLKPQYYSIPDIPGDKIAIGPFYGGGYFWVVLQPMHDMANAPSPSGIPECTIYCSSDAFNSDGFGINMTLSNTSGGILGAGCVNNQFVVLTGKLSGKTDIWIFDQFKNGASTTENSYASRTCYNGKGFSHIAYGNGIYVLTSDETNVVLWSKDLTTFTSLTPAGSDAAERFSNLIFADGLFFIADLNTGKIYTSQNGSIWLVSRVAEANKFAHHGPLVHAGGKIYMFTELYATGVAYYQSNWMDSMSDWEPALNIDLSIHNPHHVLPSQMSLTFTNVWEEDDGSMVVFDAIDAKKAYRLDAYAKQDDIGAGTAAMSTYLDKGLITRLDKPITPIQHGSAVYSELSGWREGIFIRNGDMVTAGNRVGNGGGDYGIFVCAFQNPSSSSQLGYFSSTDGYLWKQMKLVKDGTLPTGLTVSTDAYWISGQTNATASQYVGGVSGKLFFMTYERQASPSGSPSFYAYTDDPDTMHLVGITNYNPKFMITKIFHYGNVDSSNTTNYYMALVKKEADFTAIQYETFFNIQGFSNLSNQTSGIFIGASVFEKRLYMGRSRSVVPLNTREVTNMPNKYTNYYGFLYRNESDDVAGYYLYLGVIQCGCANPDPTYKANVKKITLVRPSGGGSWIKLRSDEYASEMVSLNGYLYFYVRDTYLLLRISIKSIFDSLPYDAPLLKCETIEGVTNIKSADYLPNEIAVYNESILVGLVGRTTSYLDTRGIQFFPDSMVSRLIPFPYDSIYSTVTSKSAGYPLDLTVVNGIAVTNLRDGCFDPTASTTTASADSKRKLHPLVCGSYPPTEEPILRTPAFQKGTFTTPYSGSTPYEVKIENLPFQPQKVIIRQCRDSGTTSGIFIIGNTVDCNYNNNPSNSLFASRRGTSYVVENEVDSPSNVGSMLRNGFRFIASGTEQMNRRYEYYAIGTYNTVI